MQRRCSSRCRRTAAPRSGAGCTMAAPRAPSKTPRPPLRAYPSRGAAYDEGLDEPPACTLFLGSSSMEMGKMLSCTAHEHSLVSSGCIGAPNWLPACTIPLTRRSRRFRLPSALHVDQASHACSSSSGRPSAR